MSTSRSIPPLRFRLPSFVRPRKKNNAPHRSVPAALTAALSIETLEPRYVLASAVVDTAFSGDGKLTTAMSTGGDIAYDVAAQPDGKLVVVGTANVDFGVARYNTDGTLDNTFSGDGKVTTSIGGNDRAYAVAIQPDGKILVAGEANFPGTTNRDVAVVRYNANGSLDTTFGSGGIAHHALDTGADVVSCIALQPDGKIVLGGFTDVSASGAQRFLVVRLTAAGALDNTFSGDGKFVHNAGTNAVKSVYVQSDGKILFGGFATNSFAVGRLTASGSLDSTFNSGAIFTTLVQTGSTDNNVEELAVQSNGKIVAAGYLNNGGNYDVGLIRLTSVGVLDTTFDGDGKVVTSVGTSHNYARDLAIQPDGKILVAGNSRVGSFQDYAVLRYNSNGSLDTTFTADGSAITSIGSADDDGYGMALQPDGNIVVVGSSYNGTNDDWGVARLLNTVSYAGGPYTVAEGTPLQLNAEVSSDEIPAGFTYEWDFDYDGSNLQIDATGFQPTVTFPDSFFPRPMAVRITDPQGLVGIHETSLYVYNVAPSLYASGLEKINLGLPYTLHLESRDPGTDTISSWKVTWGDGVTQTVTGNPSSVTHTYPAGPGTYNISVTATDEDGTYSGSSLSVSLQSVQPPSGAVDTSFGGNAGWIGSSFGSSVNALAHDALVQHDGKIVLAGTAGLQLALARYYPDGSLDRSFGGTETGMVITNVSGANRFGDVAFGVALAPDGKIVIGGQADFPGVSNRDFLVARYTADGVLDPTFAGDGTVITANTTRGDYGLSVAVQPDSKVVVGGLFDNNGNVEFGLLRYTAAGALDATFSGDGSRSFPIRPASWWGKAPP